MSKNKCLIHAIICAIIAGWLLYLMAGCSTKNMVVFPDFYDGVCRHDCLAAGSILKERFPKNAFIAFGPTKDREGYHCQACLFDRETGEKKYFSMWNGAATEVPQDFHYDPDELYTLEEFFNRTKRWRD